MHAVAMHLGVLLMSATQSSTERDTFTQRILSCLDTSKSFSILHTKSEGLVTRASCGGASFFSVSLRASRNICVVLEMSFTFILNISAISSGVRGLLDIRHAMSTAFALMPVRTAPRVNLTELNFLYKIFASRSTVSCIVGHASSMSR